MTTSHGCSCSEMYDQSNWRNIKTLQYLISEWRKHINAFDATRVANLRARICCDCAYPWIFKEKRTDYHLNGTTCVRRVHISVLVVRSQSDSSLWHYFYKEIDHATVGTNRTLFKDVCCIKHWVNIQLAASYT